MTNDQHGNTWNTPSYDAIVRALFETYESLYDIDVETSAYQCYHESKSFQELQLARSGADFFRELSTDIEKTIQAEDREYVRAMMEKETMLRILRKEKYYSFVYRLMKDGEPVYHKIRAAIDRINGREHILIGVRNVDETIRQEQAHTAALASMNQKEKNHMEAVLASAAGYLEVNLTRDLLLEISPFFSSSDGDSKIAAPQLAEPRRYSDLNRWMCENLIIENTEVYRRVASREYLISCFEWGEKRASLSFSTRKENGKPQPCREVIYLYQDDASENVHAFCVVYDLTAQQRKEKEMQDLERALQMSRIRNFTSQMQPHFLYNALGSIQEIVLDDPEYASELIGDFTIHLRSCIRAMANDAPLPFDQELANIRAYVNIEKMRFGKKLKVVYDIPTVDFAILPLSVQPLVENAIRHGIYQRGPQGGTVTIRTRERADRWIVEVEDDGVGFDKAELPSGASAGKQDSAGLKNLTFRLDKVMHASVDIHSVKQLGTKVTISIPKGAQVQ